MPFRSRAQMRFMFAKHPGIAKEFADKTPSMKKLPEVAKPMYGGGYADGGRAEHEREFLEMPEHKYSDYGHQEHYYMGGMADGGEAERERHFLEQDDEDDGEWNVGHQEHYAHGGYAARETEMRESEEYPMSESNVYGNTDEPESWTEIGDIEENPDADEEEERRQHLPDVKEAEGYAEGGEAQLEDSYDRPPPVDPYAADLLRKAQERKRRKMAMGGMADGGMAAYARALMNRRRG